MGVFTKTWVILLQNDAWINNISIAIDGYQNIYVLNTSRSNGSCNNNQYKFTIQYVTGNVLTSQKMSFNGCSNPMALQDVTVDANNQVYVSLTNGNIPRVYYNNGQIVY